MSFFGITSYGAQNVLKSARYDAFDITLFTLEEFSETYDKICHKEGVFFIDIEKHVPLILEMLFKGPVPPVEMDRVMNFFRRGDIDIDSEMTLRNYSSLRTTGDLSLSKCTDTVVDHALNKQQFLDGIFALQEAKEDFYRTEENKPGVNFKSFDVLKTTKIKEMRPEHGPGDLFVTPVTTTQTYGWNAHILPSDKRHSKKHCEETKFAAELLKFGIHY